MNGATSLTNALKLLCLLLSFSCSTDKGNITAINNAQEITSPEQTQIQSLKEIKPSMFIGGNIAPLFDIPKYLSIHKTHFNANQALWYAGFGGWPEAKVFEFENFNSLVNWMHENDISAHNHMLVGPNFYMPAWLVEQDWSDQELDNHLQNLIYSIMDSNDNKNKVDVWNIINEVFNQDGTYKNKNDLVWVQLGYEDDASGLSEEDIINTQHPVFIRKAFGYAREKTDKTLEYRDYLIEATDEDSGWNRKHKAVYQLLKHMQNTNIPIDAIGIQGHYDIGNLDWILTDNRLKNAIEKFKTLNLEVYLTELDIGSKEQEWTTALKNQQKIDYYNVIMQAVEGGADRIYTWGIQDGLDKFWRTNEHPLPWDEELEPKPAFFGIKEALEDSNLQ